MPNIAIIGAGPSGLVTAKSLLQHFPESSLVIFDSQHRIGGLWNVSSDNDQTFKLDPEMPTNLSRFTVAFSDLDWESVITEVPVFPRARQVGQYLDAYADRYIPSGVFRLGCKVVATSRKVNDEGVKWNVQWLESSGSTAEKLCSEEFDFLVVASGYFAEQYTPNVPGLAQFSKNVIHSSSLHQQRDTISGTTVVIGGSMSGAEAASAISLSQSSSMLANNEIPNLDTKVHHIHSRPFWTLPTYLPHAAEDNLSFHPLDLAMYDLSRRPPGPIEYALGPIPEQKAVKTDSYFRSLLGNDYEQYAHMATGQQKIQPPWVAIDNNYAEFVRAGTIQASMGRVISVKSDAGLASVQYTDSNNNIKSIENVTKIVMATGFTPFKILSILPEDVLSKLEYSAADPFSPLILDKGGTVRSEIPDIGFVGFYRGPYWGIMEMQARFLSSLWTGTEPTYTDEQKQNLRSLRTADPDLARGQFPMGDYVGLMETFAKDLGISRSNVNEDALGPTVPARYGMGQEPSPKEATRTLDALRDTLMHDGAAALKAAASAIFRALHGRWKFVHISGIHETAGFMSFYPRYPTGLDYEREYVVEKCAGVHGQTSEKVYSIMRLAETRSRASSIDVWSVGLADGFTAKEITGSWEFSPLRREMNGDEPVPGEYVISAKSVGPSGSTLYTFHLTGVSISTWDCVELESTTDMEVDGSKYRSRTVYER